MNTVLTLKDRGILEEGDDDEEVLVNVNILDDERVQLQFLSFITQLTQNNGKRENGCCWYYFKCLVSFHCNTK